MIEVLFSTGIISQILFSIGKSQTKHTRLLVGLGVATIVLGCILAYCVYVFSWRQHIIVDMLMTGSAVIGILFSIVWGLLSFEMAQKVSPIHIVVLHIVALTLWLQHPEFHTTFVWHYLVIGMAPFSILFIIPKVQKLSIVKHIYYLWHLMLLLFFGVYLFLPLTTVFEPEPIEALFGGALLLSIATTLFFSCKYFAIVVSCSLHENKEVRERFQWLENTLITQHTLSIQGIIFTFLGIASAYLLTMNNVDEITIVQLLLLFYFNTSSVMTNEERKKVVVTTI